MIDNGIAREVLDYEQLVNDYNASLAKILRHHQSVGALEIWVPDDDPTKSILNMVEAAEITGLGELFLRVGAQTAAVFDPEAFRKAAALLGTVEIQKEGEALMVSVTQIGGGANETVRAARSTGDWFASVGEAYRDAVLIAAGKIAHEGSLEVPYGHTRFAAGQNGITLAVAVDSHHTITAAAHEGTTLRPDRAVLDTFCALLPGLTIQEASDHSVQQLERQMRSGQRPVPGIALPENADPIFSLPLALIREISEAYAAATGYAPGRNTSSPRAAAGWIALGRDEKLAQLQRAIGEAASHVGLQVDDIRVVEIEMHVKVTVVFREQVEVERKPKILMDVERILRRQLEPTLQLFSIELKDASKLRRL